MLRTAALLLALTTLACAAGAEEPRAARSVHLHYAAPEAVVFYNEVRVLESQNGAYFCVCGFGHGYFGIQQLGSPDKKVILFSVWDPTKGDNPNAVAGEDRVAVLYHDPAVEVKRFGGEGTGGQSFFKYPWKVGERYRFAIRAEPAGEKTAYTAFFYLNDEKAWKRLATFQTRTGGEALKGFYSFVEDFRRDGKSPHERRRAEYANGWALSRDGYWISLTRATFTGDSTPLENVNAAPREDGFLLETGGDVTQSRPLRSRLTRSPGGLPSPEAFEAPASRPAAPSR